MLKAEGSMKDCNKCPCATCAKNLENDVDKSMIETDVAFCLCNCEKGKDCEEALHIQ